MATKRDYYDVLGVDRDASEADVKKAFRRLARDLHPDVNPGDPDAAEGFREASEAYEALSNPDTRARYDRFGHAGVAGTQFHPEQFMDFSNLSDLLGAFFGDDLFGGARRPARGGDAVAAVDLTLVEAAFGVTREVDVDIISPCDRCEGSGAEPGTMPQTCPSCGGSGHVQHVSNTAFGQFVQTAPCAACRGRGVKIDTPCTACRGRGRRRAHESVEVQIPAGIMSGQRLRMPGRGHTGENGAARGDLYVNVTVAADERFEREGNDIVSVLDIPFTRAAFGTTTPIETLEGRHELEIRPGTQPGEVLVLRGKGIPVLGGRGRGDHRVVVNVLVPRKLSEEQRTLLDRFEATVDDTTYAADDGFFHRLRTAFR
ncbi:MAG TPA: molecular chaperone DnaJ [Gaiellales bacterium]|nr:molecular chaperone DnaJ [Gaiellales bacterium]